MTRFGEGVAVSAGFSPLHGVTMLNEAIPAGGRSIGGNPSAEAMRQQSAAVIQRCYRWLEATVPIAPQVTALVPILITVVQQYEAEQYAASLSGAVSAIQTAQALHTNVPMLPMP